MVKNLRHSLLSLRELLLSAGPFVLLTAALLVLAFWWLKPNPPTHVVLATGPAQSAYDSFGRAYAQALARHGITVQLRATEGASDNLALLQRGEVDLGFVQGGSGTLSEADKENLQSLGSLFVEPLWLFYREARAANKPVNTLTDLKGWRVNIGTSGSGTPQLFQRLIEANGLTTSDFKLSQLEQTPATVAFINGDIDALMFVSAPEAVMVQMLLQTPGVRLMAWPQAQAYSRRFGFLTPVVLPRGVVDLARDHPARDVPLIASTTSLIARADTHPAISQLMTQAALPLHSPAGWFNQAREFPSLAFAELPIAKDSERVIRNGPPLLQRYLPFGIANLMERMWLSLGLIIALALPLSRIAPPLYAFRIRRRVFRWYALLRDIEEAANAPTSAGPDVADCLQRLDGLEATAEKIQVPLAYHHELYALRQHIHGVRKKLLQKRLQQNNAATLR